MTRFPSADSADSGWKMKGGASAASSSSSSSSSAPVLLHPLLQQRPPRQHLCPLQPLVLLPPRQEEKDGLGVRRLVRADVTTKHRRDEQRHPGSHVTDRAELSVFCARRPSFVTRQHDCDERLRTAQLRRSSARVASTSGAVAPAASWRHQCEQHQTCYPPGFAQEGNAHVQRRLSDAWGDVGEGGGGGGGGGADLFVAHEFLSSRAHSCKLIKTDRRQCASPFGWTVQPETPTPVPSEGRFQASPVQTSPNPKARKKDCEARPPHTPLFGGEAQQKTEESGTFPLQLKQAFSLSFFCLRQRLSTLLPRQVLPRFIRCTRHHNETIPVFFPHWLSNRLCSFIGMPYQSWQLCRTERVQFRWGRGRRLGRR